MWNLVGPQITVISHDAGSESTHPASQHSLMHLNLCKSRFTLDFCWSMSFDSIERQKLSKFRRCSNFCRLTHRLHPACCQSLSKKTSDIRQIVSDWMWMWMTKDKIWFIGTFVVCHIKLIEGRSSKCGCAGRATSVIRSSQMCQFALINKNWVSVDTP